MTASLPDPLDKWFNERNQAIVASIGSTIGFVSGLVLGFGEAGFGGALLFGVVGAIVGMFLSGFVSWIFNAEMVAGCLLILAGLAVLSLPFLFFALVAVLWDVGN